MASEFLVGQAVITDPFGSGFQMRAVSESVAPEDRVFLLEMPHVSNYLLLLQEPGRYLSFQRLPSGAWALGHRFVHGQRRAGLNRVVDHILIVPGALLEAVLGDAWLLIAGCRFHAGGEWRLFTELSELVGEPDVREAPSLEVRLPDDPRDMRFRMIESRCNFLKERLGSEQALRDALVQILGAFEAGCGVLLPQDQIHEQLLALAWSVLPLEDRLRIFWTTHLGGGGAGFRLALTPMPEMTRHQQNDPHRWALLGEPLMSPGGGGESLAAVIGSKIEHFSAIDEGLTTYNLSLERPSEVVAWVQWNLGGNQWSPQGFHQARELAAFFDRQRLSGEESLRFPWLTAGQLLQAVALTVVRQAGEGAAWNDAVKAVSEVLAAHGLGTSLLEPDRIVKLIRRAKEQGEAQAAMGALALFLASPDWRFHNASRGTLLSAVQARGALSQAAGLESAPVFVQLAESVVQLVPEKAETAYRMVQQNGGLAMALQALEARPSHLVHLRAIFRVARKAEDRAVAGRVARDYLIPLLAKDPAQAKVDELGRMVLEALRAVPEGLVQAFSEWKDEDLYDTAVKTLRSWAEESFAGALAVAARLASETYNGVPDLVRERPSTLGMARALANAGSPAADWLVFALAEASLIDGTNDRKELRSFRDFLRTAPIREDGIEPALRKLLARFHRIPPATFLGPAHQVLVTCLAGPLGRHPTLVSAALAQLAMVPSADPLLWGEAVSVAATAIAATDARIASQIARNWWTGLTTAALQLDIFPEGALQMLKLLSAQDAASVLDQWAPKFPALGLHPRAQALVESFEALARQHGLKDQEFLCEVGGLARVLRHQEGSLEEAIETTVARASVLEQSESRLAAAVSQLLPASPIESAQALFSLLVSSKLHPETKAFLEKRFLDRALDRALNRSRGSLQLLPAVESLVQRPALLLKVARRVGRSWSQHPEEVRAFVRRLAELKRYDALGTLLRGADSSGKSFVAHAQVADPELYKILQDAAQQPAGRGDLARFKELAAQGSD